MFTNGKRIDTKEEKKLKKFKTDKSGDIKDNLIIKGNNLLVLHSLKKRFARKVKLIYIDPPYNTGNDSFGYNDKFNHSSWLTFMKNRLDVAKDLLSENGIIFISIDDNEHAYLKVLCDEVFGMNNYITSLIKKSKIGGGSDSKHIVKEHEYIVCYAKNIEQLPEMFIKHNEKYLKRYKERDKKGRFFWDTFSRPGLKNPITYDIEAPDGKIIRGDWIRSKKRFTEDLKKGEIRFVKMSSGEWSVQFKQRLNKKGKKPRSMITDTGGTIEGKKDIKKLFGNDKIFSYPKSVELIQFLIEMINDKEAIVMDFFAGSGTTGHATIALNRKDGGKRSFVLVEQLDEHVDICLKRINKVLERGDSTKEDFVYMELAKWNESFINKITKAKTTQELRKIWKTLHEKAHLSHKVDLVKFDANANNFKKLSFADQKLFLFEVMDQNHLYINYSEIDDKEYKVSQDDKKLNKLLYRN